jgi:glutamine amidotransferase
MGSIAVIDYGMGNLRSVAKALEHVADARQRVVVTADPAIVHAAERVVFPGQGAAQDCMRQLNRNGLGDAVRAAAGDKPFLGLCMGMQALLSFSDENGGTSCLDLLSGHVRSLREAFAREGAAQLKIPHMGWNQVVQRRSHPLWRGLADGSRFYFVHSYYAVPDDAEVTLGMTEYGLSFASAIGRENVFAMQCHPEKSAAVGLNLLRNFVRWNGAA